ncbi:hypothetical protein IT570_00845 [Candidatus Sumerlaeota bacterium]|nr:hypothetical protein [Candidatus Sumerlaeota bacterium]
MSMTEHELSATFGTVLDPKVKGTSPALFNPSFLKMSPDNSSLYLTTNTKFMKVDIATGNRSLINVTLGSGAPFEIGPAVEIEGRSLPSVTEYLGHLTNTQKFQRQSLVGSDLNTDYRIDSSDLDVRANRME